MITPNASVTIAASPREVITFIADPSNARRWMKALEVSELITPGPIRVGSRFREVQRAGGARIETICEVGESEPEAALVAAGHMPVSQRIRDGLAGSRGVVFRSYRVRDAGSYQPIMESLV